MKKAGRRTKRATKKILAVLLILSICFSTMNMKAMAQEELAVTQTEADERENGVQPDEGENDSEADEEESGVQPGEGENDSKPGEDESGTKPSEGDSQPSEDESGSDDNSAEEDTVG